MIFQSYSVIFYGFVLMSELHRIVCCPRDKSRIVRKMIQEIVYPVYKKKNVTIPRSCPFVEARDMYYLHETHKTKESYARWACEFFYPVYKKKNVSMPRSCPFVEARDMYYLHETHKTEESYARWACEFCGKTFYAEMYLDNHLQNRHSDKILKSQDAVCLSDYCDIFRCDIVSGAMKPDFWDSALCIEDDMAGMVEMCDRVFTSCRPTDIPRNESEIFINKLKSPVCSLLTCSRYWDTGQVDKSQWKMLGKTVLTVLLFSFMIIYYFLAYHHFYSEPLFEDTAPVYFTDYDRHNQLLRKPHRKRRRHKISSS